MEENQENPLFGLSIDHAAKTDFLLAAKWGRLTGICGIAFFSLMVTLALISGADTASLPEITNDANNDSASLTAYWLGGVSFYVVLSSVFLFFPSFFLLRFSSRILTALKSDDQVSLNAGIKRMKVWFRYIGILMILILLFFALIFLVKIIRTGTVL